MGAFNVVTFPWTDPRSGQIRLLRAQFHFGDSYQYEYRVGDVIRWGGNDQGVAEREAEHAIVEGFLENAPDTVYDEVEVHFRRNVIAGVLVTVAAPNDPERREQPGLADRSLGAQPNRAKGDKSIPLKYSVDLYFRVEDLGKALEAASATDDKPLAGWSTRIILPNGTIESVPFDPPPYHYHKRDKAKFTCAETIALEARIKFWEDEVLHQAWLDGTFARDWTDDSGEHFELASPGGVSEVTDPFRDPHQAYFYPFGFNLSITCDKQYARLAFAAQGSAYSRALERSMSIRNHFRRLLTAAGGVLGLINIEQWDYLLLEDPAFRISADRPAKLERKPRDGHTRLNLDAFVTQMLAVKAEQQARWQTMPVPAVFYADWINCFGWYLSPWWTLGSSVGGPQKEPAGLVALFASHLGAATDQILATLLLERSWLARCVGSCLVAFGKRRQFTEHIGRLLLRFPFHAEPLCLALARLNNPEAVEFLEQYLERYLVLSNTEADERGELSLDWALAALIWLDAQNGSDRAQKYLAPDGLWSLYIEQASRYEIGANIHRATAELASALEFAQQFDVPA